MRVNTKRFNAYQTMWTLVMYDLPTETKKQRKAAGKFRKDLLKDGFDMFQFSMYVRHSTSNENAYVHKNRVKKSLPDSGKVGILQVTDKQFASMELYFGTKEMELPKISQQLELF